MKTEKRLTMALSVLVALMMLAVPFASMISNDEGSVDSVDAPMLGAIGEGYQITFNLNVPDDSLDQIRFSSMNLSDEADKYSWVLSEDKKSIVAIVKEGQDVTYGDLVTAINNALISVREGYDLGANWTSGNISYDKDSPDKVESSATLSNTWTLKDNYIEVIVNVEDELKGNSTYTKAYKIDDGAESDKVHTFVTDDKSSLETLGQIDLKGFVINNAPRSDYAYADGYGSEPGEDPGVRNVYGLTITDSSGQELIGKKISSGDKITAKTSLKSDYYAVEVYSKVFESKLTDGIAVVYAFKSQPATFNQLFSGLQYLDETGKVCSSVDRDEDSTIAPIFTGVKALFTVTAIPESEQYTADDGNWLLKQFLNMDDTFAGTLNDTKNLVYDSNYVGTEFKLESELMGYKVVFMVNGQFEIVSVAYGTDIAPSLTTLDTTGVNNWVYVKGSGDSEYNGLNGLGSLTSESKISVFDGFGFTNTEKTNVESQAKDAAKKATPIEFALVLVANFQAANKTSYAVFDANDHDGNLAAVLAEGDDGLFFNNDANKEVDTTVSGEKIANFGDKLITKIVVSGENGKSISTLPANPVISSDAEEKDKYLYLAWFKHEKQDTDLKFTLDLGKFNVDASTQGVVYISADWEKYKYTITFHVDDAVNGVFYYTGDISYADLDENLVAFSYDGKLYAYYYVCDNSSLSYNNYTSTALAATDAYAHVLDPFKAGYEVDAWYDAPSDGKKMLEEIASSYIKRVSGGESRDTQYIINTYEYICFDEDLKANVDLYADFKPLGYTILYKSNSADSPNSVTQSGVADETIKLYDKETFSNDKTSVIICWNDRPDQLGTRYELGADFKLTGEQLNEMGITAYDSASSETSLGGITLYAIWEKQGGSSDDGNQGGSSGSSGDNNSDSGMSTETIILAAILVLIIIALIVIVIMMRKK